MTSPGWRDAVALLRPRRSRGQAIVAVLVGLLGFAIALQVHATRSSGALATQQPSDLVGLLGDLTARSARLRSEITSLEVTEQQLRVGSSSGPAAAAAARQRLLALEILSGAIPASGPGIVLTIEDPAGAVRADVLLDALEELRNAGAEVIQINTVRVVAGTYLVDAPAGAISCDGAQLRPPYVFEAIGDPKTLAAAMQIPGGVVDTVDARSRAAASVSESSRLVIRALHRANGGR